MIGFGAPVLLEVTRHMVRPWVRQIQATRMPLGWTQGPFEIQRISDLNGKIANCGQSIRNEWQLRLDVSLKIPL